MRHRISPPGSAPESFTTNGTAIFQLGTTYQQLGRLTEAQEHLARVLQLHEQNPEVIANAAVRHHVLAHYLSGIALTRLGRFAEAYAHLTAVKSSGRAGASTATDLDALIAYCASNKR